MLNEVKSRNTGRKLISFIHISLDSFVAGPNGEMNRIKVDEEVFKPALGLLQKIPG